MVVVVAVVVVVAKMVVVATVVVEAAVVVGAAVVVVGAKVVVGGTVVVGAGVVRDGSEVATVELEDVSSPQAAMNAPMMIRSTSSLCMDPSCQRSANLPGSSGYGR